MHKMILKCACIVMVLSHSCVGQIATEKEAVPVPEAKNENMKEFDMKKDIEEIENLAHDAENMLKTGTPIEAVERVYDEMITVLDDIEDAFKNPENVNKFIDANGFFRIFSIHLHNNDTALRTKLLNLFKDLLDKIPEETKADLPLNIIDRVLSIFENDDNVAIKGHAVDILARLLPKNPTAQLRVMKMKGLDVFYNQINKLDISVIDILMDLFNKIVKEHVEVKNNSELKDAEEKLMYQRMGLMELLSTPTVCNGILDIFKVIWSPNSHDHGNIKIFMELLKNMKQFCFEIYKRKPIAITFFESLIENVKEGDKIKLFGDNVNFEEFLNTVEDYVVRDEEGKKEGFQKEFEEVKDDIRDEF